MIPTAQMRKSTCEEAKSFAKVLSGPVGKPGLYNIFYSLYFTVPQVDQLCKNSKTLLILYIWCKQQGPSYWLHIYISELQIPHQ